MNFRRHRRREEPEINMIPLIDLMLVILIFITATTTYAKYAGLKINLPVAQAEQKTSQAKELEIAVAANGQYALNGERIAAHDAPTLATALRQYIQQQPEPLVIINADSQANHQAVINVMEAARLVGLNRLSFATQTPP